MAEELEDLRRVAEAAERVLGKFGDEYEGRFAELKTALARWRGVCLTCEDRGFMVGAHNDHYPCPECGTKKTP